MIKPHPHGSFSFEWYFPESIVLDKTFPIEFLQFLPNCSIKNLVSIETSAVEKIYNLVENDIVASRYWMLKLEEIIPLYTSLLIEQKLSNYRLLHFYSDSLGIYEIATVLSAALSHKKIKIEESFIELGISELAVTRNYAEAVQFSPHVHKFSIIQNNNVDMPVFQEGSSSIYIAGNIGPEECKTIELSFELKHSGFIGFLKYEGECK